MATRNLEVRYSHRKVEPRNRHSPRMVYVYAGPHQMGAFINVSAARAYARGVRAYLEGEGLEDSPFDATGAYWGSMLTYPAIFTVLYQRGWTEMQALDRRLP